jgi:hypothetical protein
VRDAFRASSPSLVDYSRATLKPAATLGNAAAMAVKREIDACVVHVKCITVEHSKAKLRWTAGVVIYRQSAAFCEACCFQQLLEVRSYFRCNRLEMDLLRASCFGTGPTRPLLAASADGSTLLNCCADGGLLLEDDSKRDSAKKTFHRKLTVRHAP